MTRVVGAYHDYRPFVIPGSSKNTIEDNFWSSNVRTQTSSTKPKLEAQCWYHGKIKRVDAISLLKNNGDFLVRDSISNPGDYVLTGLCLGQPMHFEIHRAPSSDPAISLYYFEDEQFRSVVDLIQFYFNHQRKVTAKSQFILITPISNDGRQETSMINKFQTEIEATYAPFINKQAQFSARYDRSLSHTAIINQAKKRLNGSEHDLMHLLASPNNLSTSKSYGQLNQVDGKAGIKVTSFGIDENDGYCVETTFVPPKSERQIPQFPPPKSPIAYPEDLDDYDDIDYDAMDDAQTRATFISSLSPPAPVKSPPAIPPKPLSLKQKRHSEFIDTKDTVPPISDPTRKHSAHSLFQASQIGDQEESEESLPAYLDRTQSCQNLVYRQRTKSNRDLHEPEDVNLPRYPSVKIEVAPMLPARSKDSLCSLSALVVSEKKENTDYDDVKTAKKEVDYDDVKTRKGDNDYDGVKARSGGTDYDQLLEEQSKKVTSPEILPKPKNLAQLRAMSQPPKQIRHLLNYIASLTPERLSLLITSEDLKIFKLTKSNPSESLKLLFLAEHRLLRDEVFDRNACIQLTVAMTLQKAVNPKDILKTWILTASHLLHKIGNGFSFGAITAALIAEKRKKPRLFSELDPAVSSHFRNLSQIHEEFMAGKMPSSIATCFLPFIQPLLQLFSASDYVQANKLKSINTAGLDDLEILSNMILLARHVLFDNQSTLNQSIESSIVTGANPLSTESLFHCLLSTSSITEPKEADRRKIRQMFEQSF